MDQKPTSVTDQSSTGIREKLWLARFDLVIAVLSALYAVASGLTVGWHFLGMQWLLAGFFLINAVVRGAESILKREKGLIIVAVCWLLLAGFWAWLGYKNRQGMERERARDHK